MSLVVLLSQVELGEAVFLRTLRRLSVLLDFSPCCKIMYLMSDGSEKLKQETGFLCFGLGFQ